MLLLRKVDEEAELGDEDEDDGDDDAKWVE